MKPTPTPTTTHLSSSVNLNRACYAYFAIKNHDLRYFFESPNHPWSNNDQKTWEQYFFLSYLLDEWDHAEWTGTHFAQNVSGMFARQLAFFLTDPSRSTNFLNTLSYQILSLESSRALTVPPI